MLTDFQATLTGSYDRFFQNGRLYVGERSDTGYANLGLFDQGTSNFAQACNNMMAKIVSKFTRRDGPLLDVGCGLGGTSEYLAQHFPVDSVYGINVSQFQIEKCRERLPAAHFQVMPAEKLRFADATFQAIVSVEAALHFKGRREFLQESWRVMKSRGEIVVADMVFNGEPKAFRKVLSGQECYEEINAYRALWESCGFVDVMIEDITQASWRSFTEHFKSQLLGELLKQSIDKSSFTNLLGFVRKIEQLPVLAYVIVHAKKPA